MDSLTEITKSLPPQWKWDALFTPPAAPHDREWRAWLAQAQLAEEQATLAYWARRQSASR